MCGWCIRWKPRSGCRDPTRRTRLALRQHTTTLKNRIHGALRRYGQYEVGGPRKLFAGKGRVQLSVYVGALPPETRLATRHEWELVDQVEAHIRELEMRIRLGIGQLGYVRLLKMLPGVGEILAATVYLEIGEVGRFGQLRDHEEALRPAACGAALRTVTRQQEPRQGRRGPGAALGGGQLVGAHQETSLSRAGAGFDVFVRERVSAVSRSSLGRLCL